MLIARSSASFRDVRGSHSLFRVQTISRSYCVNAEKRGARRKEGRFETALWQRSLRAAANHDRGNANRSPNFGCPRCCTRLGLDAARSVRIERALSKRPSLGSPLREQRLLLPKRKQVDFPLLHSTSVISTAESFASRLSCAISSGESIPAKHPAGAWEKSSSNSGCLPSSARN